MEVGRQVLLATPMGRQLEFGQEPGGMFSPPTLLGLSWCGASTAELPQIAVTVRYFESS